MKRYFSTFLLMTLLYLSGDAQDSKGIKNTESRSTFEININGKKYQIAEDEELKLDTILSKTIISIKLSEFKKFDNSSISFEYPRHSASDKVKSGESKDSEKVITQQKEKGSNYWSGYKDPTVVATLLLFIFTALLYYEASKSGKAAEKAANVAKATLDEYKNEFEAANRPDVSMFNFKISEISGSASLNCSYQIINTGKFRAAFKYFTIQEHIGKDPSSYSFNSTKKEVRVNQFLQFNVTYTLNELLAFNEQQKVDFISGNTAVFFDCNYEYFNESINKSYVTHFLNKLFYVNGILSNEAVSFNEEERNIKPPNKKTKYT